METLQGLEREVARLQAEVVFFFSFFLTFSRLPGGGLNKIIIVRWTNYCYFCQVDRLRREGDEGRRRSSSQEAHFRATEQVER